MTIVAYDMQVQCTLRDSDSHDKQCSELQEDPLKSVEFDINTRSVLNKLQYFHVASRALDIMHDLLEVCLYTMHSHTHTHTHVHTLTQDAMPYESKLVLKRLIQEDFQLSDLNRLIQNFEFGYTEVSNRPTQIEHATLTSRNRMVCLLAQCKCTCSSLH